MATKKPAEPAAKKPGTSVIKWSEQLAAEAAIAAKAEEATATGSFFSTKSGVLSYGGNPVPGNAMAVVILDGINENVLYEGKFNPNEMSPPTCFAFGRGDDEMVPHDISVKSGNNQSKDCASCVHNEWGSADTGRGKACGNKRRLALLPAGTIDNGRIKLFNKTTDFETGSIGFLKLPVTSVKGYASFVKQVAAGLHRPPHGIFAKVSVVSDAASQFKIAFEVIEEIDDEFMGIIMQRREEAMAEIMSPYAAPGTEEKAPARKGAAAPKKKKF